MTAPIPARVLAAVLSSTDRAIPQQRRHHMPDPVTARHESPDPTPATDTQPGRHEAPQQPADPKGVSR